jgi:hypothetical protein
MKILNLRPTHMAFAKGNLIDSKEVVSIVTELAGR